MKFIILMLLSLSLQANSSVSESAHLAKAVYEKNPKTKFKIIYQHENEIFGNKLMAFYHSQTDTIYIAVRGTTKISNWISNTHIAENALDALADYLIPQKHQKHYHGFKKVNQAWFLSAFEDLQQASSEVLNQYPHTQVIFTGHSYGGLMANLLAQDAFLKNPDLNFKCHTFNAPGAQEIRRDTLQMPPISRKILNRRFFNHIRVTDLVAHANTQEGNLLFYQPASRSAHILEDHGIEYFAEDLENDLQPFSQDFSAPIS